MAATRILDISAFGEEYAGKTVSLREPTGTDMVAVNDYINKEKKSKGEVNAMMASLVLLSRVIEDAPFDKTPNTLQTLSLRLLRFLVKQVEDMIDPLPKSEEQD